MCFAAEPSPDVNPGTFVDPTPRRIEIARSAVGARRTHFQDLVIATGRLTNEAGDVIVCRELGLGVTRAPADGFHRPWYKVIAFDPRDEAEDGWKCVLNFVFQESPDGRRSGVEILRYVPGGWEEEFVRWGLGPDAEGRAEVVHRGDIDLIDLDTDTPDEIVASRVLAAPQRERLTREARSVLEVAGEITAREVAALLLLRVYFDRSLARHLKDGRSYTTHPDFRTYVAMLLAHEKEATRALGGDGEVVAALTGQYGQEEGLEAGHLLWTGGQEAGWRRTWAERHIEHPPFGATRFLETLGIV